MSAALGDNRAVAEGGGSLESALADALDKNRSAGAVMVSLPAPVRPSEALLVGERGPALAWAAPWGFELAALGSAVELAGRGPERFRDIARRGSELLLATKSVGVLGVPPLPARLFGGFAFQASSPRTSHWEPFGEALFVLPELGYVVENGRGTLFVAADSRRLADRRARDELVGRAMATLHTLERGMPPAPSGAHLPSAVHEGPLDEWANLVREIAAEIGRGTLEKVVLARRVSLELPVSPEPARVLARLRLEAPECTRFLVRRGDAAFLGATPERLAKKTGRELETEAVAGSMSALESDGARRLLESAKDLAEHSLVVREIVRALEPLSARVESSTQPELRELRHVLHLRTPIRATLEGPAHLLEVVERLHPTPAVGGAPTARALEWISTHERDERGWYAGPLGWFDAQGDGEMAVALRSGVLEGTRAHLYVGAGIVERSLAQAELAETRWKLAGLLSALGIAEG